jgi:ferredoxin
VNGRGTPAWLPRADLQRLLDALRERGFRVLAPVPREGTVAFDDVTRVDQLPVGLRDAQQPGRYAIEPDRHTRVFDVVHGPGSLKPFVFAPREELLQIERDGSSFRATPRRPAPERIALLGVRACDLAALRVQDRIFLHDRTPDPAYAARREGLFLVAANCTRPAATCFCVSMGTGPAARSGFDLALTETDDGFLVRADSDAGRDVVAGLALAPVPAAATEAERAALDACAAGMQRALDTQDIRERLYRSLDHPRWDDVASRCLSCGNCTMVCPTCFCHDERDEPSLDGASSLRVRTWDSCFHLDHAQVHGLNFRPETKHRYRQWLVHKLAGWVDQFGTSGCVGCGRCITWCPTGIDLTVEVDALAEPRA